MASVRYYGGLGISTQIEAPSRSRTGQPKRQDSHFHGGSYLLKTSLANAALITFEIDDAE